MKLSTSLLKGAVCYLLSFALLFYVVAKAKTHLRTAEELDYGRSIPFFLKAGPDKADHFIVTPEMANEFARQISFKMGGDSTFKTNSLEVKPQEVSWTEGKVTYIVQGGRITFAGHLTAAAVLSGVEQPLLIVLPDLPEGKWEFPRGGARGASRERVVKEYLIHPDAEAVQSANLTSAAKSAGAPALVAWAVWLLISAALAKKARNAATEPIDQVQLPRTFEPNVPHIAASFGIAALIGGCVALICFFVALDDPGASRSDSLALWSAVPALAIAAFVAWIASRQIVGAEVSLESLALARGLGRGRRREFPWEELEAARPVEKRLRSGKLSKEYLEILPAGARKPIRVHAAHLSEYHLFRDLASALWQRKHPSSAAPVVS
ncbi:MAG TPA: hypothetical protein VGO11_04600 [Chthoniobacteraceae bacterium]|jgi:hypothetical protein|nr:hypothetical protein [Chthoniobacteraceae bacterium]